MLIITRIPTRNFSLTLLRVMTLQIKSGGESQIQLFMGILHESYHSKKAYYSGTDRERGFGRTLLSNQDLIITSYLGSLNTKPFQV